MAETLGVGGGAPRGPPPPPNQGWEAVFSLTMDTAYRIVNWVVLCARSGSKPHQGFQPPRSLQPRSLQLI